MPAIALPLATPEQSKAGVQAVHLPLTFEENRGQAAPEARFVARSNMGRVLLTRDGAVLTANDGNDGAIRLRLVKARATQPQGESPTGGVANYYRTRDRRNWLTGIPMFAQVRYPGIYPGVDAMFHGHGDKLEYDFEVAAGRSPDAIGFHFEGADRVEVTNSGSLKIRKRGSCWELLPPVAYQTVKGKRREVRAGYRIAGNQEIRLKLGSYDHSAKLVVDPVVQYAGILGAGTANFVQDIAVDGSGNLVLAGGANSGFPVVNGQAGAGIFVAKLNAAGDALLFSTFIAPSGGGSLSDLKLDATGNIYLTGTAGGAGFPATTTALGTSGGFVMKLGPDGTLVFSSILGGAFPESLKVDNAGNLYVAGVADSTLQTVNAFEAIPQCTACASRFFAEINPTATAYLFSSYFYDPTATAGPARLRSIDTDASGNVYLFGQGPAPHVNAWQIGGGLFLSKFSPDGQTLLFSTDLGGGGNSETAFGMDIGADGTVFLVGGTPDNDYPYTINASRHPEGPGGNLKIFATAINPTLTGLTYSTYITDGTPGAMFLGANNHLYVAGTLTGAFPTQNAVVSDATSSGRGFFVELDATGQPVQSSPFSGHLTAEIPSAITADVSGNIFLAGNVSNQNEIPQPDPILVGPSFGGALTGGDSGTFFAKISPASAPQVSMDAAFAPFLFLRNAGSTDLHISSVTFSAGRTWGNCGATVPAGSSCVVTVSDANGNLASGTLTVSSDAQPAVQTFKATLGPGQIAGTPIGDFLWFDDDRPGLSPRLVQTIPFRIWNVGASNAIINLIGISQFASQTNDCGTGLAPGGSCTVQITIAGGGGANLNVFYDNGGFKSFLFFAPQVTQDPTLSTAGIRFPLQFVGGVSLPRTVTVTNTGGSDITVSPLLTGDPEFTIAGSSCPTPLPSGQSCAVGIQFTPVIDGSRSAVLTIGNSTVQLFAQGAITSAVQVSPLQLNFFPTVVHLANETFAVALTNTQAAATPISSIVFSQPDYTETDDCAGQVPANGSCTVQVTFTPQALGQRNGTMTVNFTGATAQVMTLTGSGVTPFSVNPHTLDFSAAVGGTSVEKGVGIGSRLVVPEGYTFTVTGDFAIAQNPCANPLTPTVGCGPTIVFQPKTPGPQQGTFTISYAGITEQDVVTLNGTGSTVQASPLQLSFPLTKIGTSATLDVTLSNSGAAAVGITSVSGSGQFSESDACQRQVPASGTCILHVIFTPQTATFATTGTLSVALADGAQYAVALSGTGTGPVIAIAIPAGTKFQDQVVGTTSNAITVSVINNGDAPLNISGISLSGDFSQTNDCPASLVSTCIITVKFSPKASGLRTGTLTLTDDGFGSPQTIQFSGNGTDFQLSAAGGSLSTSVTAGQTATYNLNITAVGSFSGQIDFACAGAPPGGACHLSAPNLTVIGSVPVPLTVTVSTSPHTSAALASEQLYLSGMNLLTGVLLLPFVLVWKRARKTMARQFLLMIIGLGIFLAIAGCGGGQSSTPPGVQNGTPSGTYTITLTSTDQTINGPVVHQTNLTLVVQ